MQGFKRLKIHFILYIVTFTLKIAVIVTVFSAHSLLLYANTRADTQTKYRVC